MCNDLPAPLICLDEQQLPVAVREEIERNVRQGAQRMHLWIDRDLQVSVDPELAMLYGEQASMKPAGEGLNRRWRSRPWADALIRSLRWSNNLPAPLADLDEQQLPAAVREEIAAMVRRGCRRRHLMIGPDLSVYVHPELAMLHGDDDDDDDDVDDDVDDDEAVD